VTRRFAAIGMGVGGLLIGTALAAAAEPEPLWAYGYRAAPKPGEAAPIIHFPMATSASLRPPFDPAALTAPRQVPGSAAAYSLAQVRNPRQLIDWFPGDHPPMPPIISRGPASLGRDTYACGYCHLPNGRGRPENAPVAGQPAAYFLQQLQDFRGGLRHTVDPRKPNTPLMIALARAMTPEEMTAAAAYFGAQKWTPWIRVIETYLVPPTKIEGNLFIATGTARTEPIAGRIIEVPENEEESEKLRDPHSGFVAYVPPGSIARGRELVTTGGATIVGGKLAAGKTLACATCHGPDLMGLGPMPGIAGRSPSYLVRQLYDIQQGARSGPMAVLMRPVVANLTGGDMVAIVAYVTSLAGRTDPPLTDPR
jgi:cytochrome c553